MVCYKGNYKIQQGQNKLDKFILDRTNLYIWHNLDVPPLYVMYKSWADGWLGLKCSHFRI